VFLSTRAITPKMGRSVGANGTIGAQFGFDGVAGGNAGARFTSCCWWWAQAFLKTVRVWHYNYFAFSFENSRVLCPTSTTRPGTRFPAGQQCRSFSEELEMATAKWLPTYKQLDSWSQKVKLACLYALLPLVLGAVVLLTGVTWLSGFGWTCMVAGLLALAICFCCILQISTWHQGKIAEYVRTTRNGDRILGL
jgi:hypothetical protein